MLVADAREVLAGIDGMRARAKGMASGLAAELAVVVDVFFPMEGLASVARDFREQFPRTPLRLFIEAPGAAVEPVIDGRANFGIVGSLPALSADHSLASWQGVCLGGSWAAYPARAHRSAPYGRGRSRHINAGRAAAANVGRLPEFCPTGAGGTMDDRAAQNLFWNRMSSSLSSGQVWFSSGSTLFRLNGSAKSGSGRGYESCRKLASAALSRRSPKNGQSAPRTASEPGRDCLPAGRMYPYSRNREKPGLAIGRRKKRCAQLDYSLMAAPRFSRS